MNLMAGMYTSDGNSEHPESAEKRFTSSPW